MWRMTPRLATATLTATLALASALAATPEAGAASVQSYAYSTSGSLSGPGYDVPITFTPESAGGTLTTPGSIALGQFTTGLLPTTATLTYNGTPFTIDLNLGPISGARSPGEGPSTASYQYRISGVLNGTIGGDGTSSMTASVTSITGNDLGRGTTPPFPASDLAISPQGIAAPGGYTPGVTTLTAQVVAAGLPLPAPAPEPSTLAVLGLALAGWACRRRSRAKAKANA